MTLNLQSRANISSRGFKALKQMTKLLFLVLHRPNDALKTYIELLTYTKSAVTRNYSEKSINGILDYVGGGKGGVVEVIVLEKFYQATRKALEEAKNEVSRPSKPSSAKLNSNSHNCSGFPSRQTWNSPSYGWTAKSILDFRRSFVLDHCSLFRPWIYDEYS